MYKYKGYKAVDFLKDEDFLRWSLFRQEEDELYWTRVANDTPELKPVIDEAEKLVRSQIRLNDYSLANEFIESSYASLIEKLVRRRRWRAVGYSLAAAASLLLCFTVARVFVRPAKPETDLMGFVNGISAPADSSADDIRLYVSSGESMNIEEKDAEISYGADSVRINGRSFVGISATEYNRLLVPKGKRSKLLLSDGTVVNVNSATAVVYPNSFEGDTREIYVNGEIFLDVAHDENRPFIVRTRELAIRVLGTRFNVQAYEEEKGAQVVLETGSVQVSSDRNADDIRLEPSQMYDYKGEGRGVVTKVDVDKYISWVEGSIYVNDERLDALMRKLSRYYGEDIRFDESIVSQRCSGKVDLKDDLGEVLGGLTFSFPIKVERENGVYIVSAK